MAKVTRPGWYVGKLSGWPRDWPPSIIRVIEVAGYTYGSGSADERIPTTDLYAQHPGMVGNYFAEWELDATHEIDLTDPANPVVKELT